MALAGLVYFGLLFVVFLLVGLLIYAIAAAVSKPTGSSSKGFKWVEGLVVIIIIIGIVLWFRFLMTGGVPGPGM